MSFDHYSLVKKLIFYLWAFLQFLVIRKKIKSTIEKQSIHQFILTDLMGYSFDMSTKRVKKL